MIAEQQDENYVSQGAGAIHIQNTNAKSEALQINMFSNEVSKLDDSEVVIQGNRDIFTQGNQKPTSNNNKDLKGVV